jgi:membrane associated rhomboid family serine protease
MVLPLGDLHRTQILPIVTYGLIALNVVMYVVQAQRGETFTTSYAATPFEISHNVDLTAADAPTIEVGRGRPPIEIPQAAVPFPVWLTLITSMFLHASPMHLIGNMLYLWIFGDNVEEVLGAVRYLIVYLCCGLIASLAQIAANPNSLIPTLGASGAIAGIMGMYIVWFPYNRVRVLVLRVIVEVPAIVVIGLWIALQVWQGAGSIRHLGETGGVAHLAHVGGAVAGVFVAFLFRDQARLLGQPTLFDRVR